MGILASIFNVPFQALLDRTAYLKAQFDAFVPPIAASVQEFTADGTWAKPAGCQLVHVELVGGGSSGAKGDGTVGPAGGSAGFIVRRTFLASDLTATVAVTIGAGGAAVSAGSTAGNSGGNTTFGSYLTALGARAGGSFQSSGEGSATGGFPNPYPSGADILPFNILNFVCGAAGGQPGLTDSAQNRCGNGGRAANGVAGGVAAATGSNGGSGRGAGGGGANAWGGGGGSTGIGTGTGGTGGTNSGAGVAGYARIIAE